jgi:very-short-patch-repair endonuclease
MAGRNVQSSEGLWALAKRQHGVVARRQLDSLGLGRHAIAHRVANGRLHRVLCGVYAVGRPELSERGRWMAAVLGCGAGAVLSHSSAAAAWQIRPGAPGPIEVSVPARSYPRGRDIRAHRRTYLPPERLERVAGIPVTDVVLTLVDIASRLRASQLEAAINEADKLELVDPETLRKALERLPSLRGIAALRRCLDRATFVLTDSELERRFLLIVRAAGLPTPSTQRHLNGFRVDFFWPGLGLVVETDGLRYHRTPAQQARDRRRDQAHARAGLTPLRFTHAQVRFEPADVRATLKAVAQRLANPAD